MEIAKKIQLTERDFVNIQHTELYTTMLNRRYTILFVDLDEAEKVCEIISKHCQSLWYLERVPGRKEEYYIYFSTDLDESIMDDGWNED